MRPVAIPFRVKVLGCWVRAWTRGEKFRENRFGRDALSLS